MIRSHFVALSVALLAPVSSGWCGGAVALRSAPLRPPLAARAVPRRSLRFRTEASPSPPPALALLQGALLRTMAGTFAGGAGGSVLHAALQAAVPASRGLVDATLNAVDVAGGLLLGLVLGVLWSTEALVVRSGVVSATVRGASQILGEDADRAAGATLLASVRAALDRLRRVPGVQGVVLRGALDLLGITSDPSVAKLAEAAEAARREGAPQRRADLARVIAPAPAVAAQQDAAAAAARGAVDGPAGDTPSYSAPPQQQSLAGVLGMVVEATLEARFFELRAALATIGVVLLGLANVALLFLDRVAR